jgi:hypothetical protein
MSRARFKVKSDKPDFNQATTATVTISRLTGVFSVRPYHRRTTYSLPLAEVAQMVLWRVIKAEAEQKLQAKMSGKPRVKLAKRGLLR